MKTTNFEISKKLAEIGFEAKTDFFWHRDINLNISFKYYPKNIELDYDEDVFPAYDLETILNALPKKIFWKGDFYYFYLISSGANNCWLLTYSSHVRAVDLEICCEFNESLADNAGRLLIKLHENNLIKF